MLIAAAPTDQKCQYVVSKRLHAGKLYSFAVSHIPKTAFPLVRRRDFGETHPPKKAKQQPANISHPSKGIQLPESQSCTFVLPELRSVSMSDFYAPTRNAA
jgi:hypothetical protein